MATYTISTAVTTAGTAQAINTNDTVTVTSSGSLNGTGTAGVGIYSSNTGGASGGFDTLNISGSVRGGEYGFWDSGSSGNDNVTVNSGGSIFGGYNAGDGAAIYIEGGSNTISNAGQIADNVGGYGIYITGDNNTITNTGTIATHNAAGYSAIYIDGGSNTVTNSGKIIALDDSGIHLTGAGHNVVSNSGSITSYASGVYTDTASNNVSNSGTIVSTNDAALDIEGGHNTISNTGSLTGTWAGIYVDDGSNKVTNSGTVAATNTDYGVGMTGAGNILINKSAGMITGAEYGVELDGKSSVAKNSGKIVGHDTGIYSEGSNNHIKILHGGSVSGVTDSGVDATGGGAHVINKGAVSGGDYGVYLDDGQNLVKVSSHGTVTGGEYGIFDDTGKTDHIFNAGTISSTSDEAIYLYSGGGSSHIHNTGTIASALDYGIYIYDGNDYITNNGLIKGAYAGVYVDDGGNALNNLAGGVIKAVAESTGYGTVYFYDDTNTVTNSGKILLATNGYTDNAAVYVDSGNNTIINNHGGLISDFHGGDTSNYAILLKDDSNTVTNNGKIVGTIQLGTSGTNTYDGSNGRLKGTVMGGDGTDNITLGAGHGSVVGGSGADAITLGSGAFTLVYNSATDSDITANDSVDSFVAGTDHFSFDLGGHAFAGLAAVSVHSLSGVTDSAIESAVAGHLDPYGAVALSVNSGLYAGDVFLVVDANGDSHFDTAANQDYLVVLTHLSGTLSSSDITTT